MTDRPQLEAIEVDLDRIEDAEGCVAVFATGDGKLDPAGRRVNRLTKGAVARVVESDRFGKLSDGEAVSLAFPAGLAAETLLVIRLERRTTGFDARAAGARVGAVLGPKGALVLASALKGAPDVALGAVLRAYDFDRHKTDGAKSLGPVSVMVKPEDMDAIGGALPLADGVWFTRDLVNEPANVLTTTEFADRLEALRDIGVKV